MSSVVIKGDTSGQVTLTVPVVAGTNTITLPALTGTAVIAGQNSAITAGTAVASTSGTSIDFTSIPSWVKRITVMFAGVSTNGTSNLLIQLGDSGGIETTGYLSGLGYRSGETTSTAGYIVALNGSSSLNFSGVIPICLYTSNSWVSSGVLSRSDGFANLSGGTKTVSDTLTQIRITTVNGTDTFDAGSINILYE
jgi:hypothetical protein